MNGAATVFAGSFSELLEEYREGGVLVSILWQTHTVHGVLCPWTIELVRQNRIRILSHGTIMEFPIEQINEACVAGKGWRYSRD